MVMIEIMLVIMGLGIEEEYVDVLVVIVDLCCVLGNCFFINDMFDGWVFLEVVWVE